MPANVTATYAVELQDEVSGAARRGASALVDLQRRIGEGTARLRAMEAGMRRLKAAATPNAQAIAGLSRQITAQRQALGAAQAQYIRLGGTFETLGRQAGAAGGGLGGLAAVARSMPGPLGSLVSRVAALAGALGPVGLLVVGVAAGLGALVAATVAATAALTRYGVAQADARRAELLRLEGLTTLRRWHGLAAGSATEMQSAIDRVADSTATSRADLEGYTRQLHRMGLRGQALSDALEGVAITASVQGDEMARRFAGMAAGAARTGRSVRALADDVRARLGGIARRQALSLDRQLERLRANVARIFDGLNIEPFLEGIDAVASTLSQARVEGRALHALFTALFQPLLGGVASVGPIVRRFLQGMIIGVLRIGVVLLRARRWLRETFGDTQLLSRIDALDLALTAGTVTVFAIAGALVVGAAAAASFAASIVLVLGPLGLAVAALGSLYLAGQRAGSALAEVDWPGLGASIVDGLVGGLRRRSRMFVDGLRSLAAQGHRALADALEIRSPSELFAALGDEIPAGVAQGVERSADRATGAAEDLLDGVRPGRGRGEPVSPRVSVAIDTVEVHTQATDAESIARSIRDQLAEVLEQLGLEIGAPA